MFGHLVFMFDWNFCYFAKIWDFIKDFAWLGQNRVKRPTIKKITKSISTG